MQYLVQLFLEQRNYVVYDFFTTKIIYLTLQKNWQTLNAFKLTDWRFELKTFLNSLKNSFETLKTVLI